MGEFFIYDASFILCWTHVCHDELSGDSGANFLLQQRPIPALCQSNDVLWNLADDKFGKFQRIFLPANLLPLCALLQHAGIGKQQKFGWYLSDQHSRVYDNYKYYCRDNKRERSDNGR